MRSSRFFAALSILFLTFSVVSARTDMMMFSNGEEKEVVVAKATPKEISYREVDSAVQQTISAGEVEYILYGDADDAFKAAFKGFRENDFRTALANFNKAKKTMKSSHGDWHTYTIDYYLAQTVMRMFQENPGSEKIMKSAEALLKKYIDEHSNTMYTPKAMASLARLYQLTGELDQATAMYEKIEENPIYPESVLLAKDGKIQVLMAKKDYDTALSECVEVIKRGGATGDLLENLLVILADKKEEYNNLTKLADVLITKNLSKAAMQKVYEMKGVAFFHEKKYKEALDYLLYSDLMLADGNIPSSDRLEARVSLALKWLMENQPVDYPVGEYESHEKRYYSRLGGDAKKYVQKYSFEE